MWKTEVSSSVSTQLSRSTTSGTTHKYWHRLFEAPMYISPTRHQSQRDSKLRRLDKTLAKDDFENMKLQFPLYDALYKYCQLNVRQGVSLQHSIPRRD